MLPGGGSFQSANVRILISRRGSGIAFGVFFVSVARLGIWSRRSIVAALIDRILRRISTSSLRCPLRSSAGRRMGKSALRRLPQTRSEASHNNDQSAPGGLVIERWASAGLPALRLRRSVQNTDGRLLVISRRRDEFLQDPALVFVRGGRIAVTDRVGQLHAYG